MCGGKDCPPGDAPRSQMKKSSSKSATFKGVDRRKKSRSARKSRSTKATQKTQEDVCCFCSKDLGGRKRALFVEEEVGRVFCSENCISNYFAPEIEELESEFYGRLSNHDLSSQEREKLNHLRWITLREPDEIWKVKTKNGFHRYILISEFMPADEKVWYICICLFLRGEPSFLYLAFPTANEKMVNAYRKGEKVEAQLLQYGKGPKAGTHEEVHDKSEPQQSNAPMTDGLADAWTEDETFRAQLRQERGSDDIPVEEFSLYQGCLDETLEAPDEVWSVEIEGSENEPIKLYHFIRHYPDEDPSIWYVIVARELEGEEQIELLDAFPTRDAELVDRYRRGKQEIGPREDRPVSRVIH